MRTPLLASFGLYAFAIRLRGVPVHLPSHGHNCVRSHGRHAAALTSETEVGRRDGSSAMQDSCSHTVGKTAP